MPSPEEDIVFNALAIRDTVNHDSLESVSGIFQAKTIFVENGLNQDVTFQLQGGRGSVWINIGATFDVVANTDDYETVTDYFPKFRLKASCSIAPTTGSLTVCIVKVA